MAKLSPSVLTHSFEQSFAAVMRLSTDCDGTSTCIESVFFFLAREDVLVLHQISSSKIIVGGASPARTTLNMDNEHRIIMYTIFFY